MDEPKLVVGVAGMPGSGKSLVLKVAEENGYGAVIMGEVVRQEAKHRGLEPTPENIGRTMLDLREKEGKSVIAKRCIPQIKEVKKNKVIVDGIRSLDEVEEFRNYFPHFSFIAICSSPGTRFQRIYRRRRSDDAEDWKIFHQRDMRELSVGLGNAIALADNTIVNEETLDLARNMVKNALNRVEEKWRK